MGNRIHVLKKNFSIRRNNVLIFTENDLIDDLNMGQFVLSYMVKTY